jgi:hypothetical protein
MSTLNTGTLNASNVNTTTALTTNMNVSNNIVCTNLIDASGFNANNIVCTNLIDASGLNVNSVTASGFITGSNVIASNNISAALVSGSDVAATNFRGNSISLIADDSSISFGSDSDVTLTHDHNVGLKLENSTIGRFTIVQGSNSGNDEAGLRLADTSTSDYWTWMKWGNDLRVDRNGDMKGYIDYSNSSGGIINFTGQHRNIMNTNITDSSVGLIVSSTGKFVNTDNTLHATINESLPLCVITNTDNDKKVFGVLSDKEDTERSRNYASGNFVSVFNKQNTNEQRMYINSVGEGAIWVCNKNGNIENGDYITSSTVPGYGVKQSDLILYAYTVAKITCDCNFSTTKIVKQKLKVISTTDTSGNTKTEIDYDANGDVQYEDDLDASGNQQMVYPLETRFLEADGSQITETQYTSKLANGENVYIACFVGCTYHCG